MSNKVEWIDADAASTIEWTTTRGEWSDAFGSMNDGVAIGFGNVIVEGTLAELRDFIVRLEDAVGEIEDSIANDASADDTDWGDAESYTTAGARP